MAEWGNSKTTGAEVSVKGQSAPLHASHFQSCTWMLRSSPAPWSTGPSWLTAISGPFSLAFGHQAWPVLLPPRAILSREASQSQHLSWEFPGTFFCLVYHVLPLWLLKFSIIKVKLKCWNGKSNRGPQSRQWSLTEHQVRLPCPMPMEMEGGLCIRSFQVVPCCLWPAVRALWGF